MMNNNSTNSSNRSKVDNVKKSNPIWWILGISCLVFVIAAAIIIYLVIGWFTPQKSTRPAELNQTENSWELPHDNNDKKIKDLENDIKKLEDELENSKKNNDSKTDHKPDESEIMPELEIGTIEGSLSYPSEQIPDLTVCAYNTTDPTDEYCTSNLIDNPNYTAGRGYQLEVPPGDYYVYSYFIDKNHVAYYTEFVPCGLDISCPSHKYITVTIKDGDHLTNIDPVDWYK